MSRHVVLSNSRLSCTGLAMLVLVEILAPTGAAAPVQQAYVKASNTGIFDQFGHSVAVDGNTMVVGALAEASRASGVNGDQSDNGAANAGAAYVFVRSGSNWIQQAYLKASNPGMNDFFGASVAVSGDTIVVGAREEASHSRVVNGNQADDSAPGAGAAYVFVRTGTNWAQQAYLKAANADANDFFGYAVAISGNTLLVGAPGESGGEAGTHGNPDDDSLPAAGAAYVFVRSGTSWTQEAYLKAFNPRTDTHFGQSVALAGDTVVIGAPYEDGITAGVNPSPFSIDGFEAGAAYVFVRSQTGWSQEAYLKASDPGAADNFGWSVSLSGNTVAVGAFQESSSATGVNGSEGNDDASQSGAAYVFVRNESIWSQQAYVKASNTGIGDRFAWSVWVSEDTLVVGAPREASNARGINGEQANNSATNSGAAYVFRRSGTSWMQSAYLKASNAEGGSPLGDNFGEAVTVWMDTVVVGARQESSNATGVNGAQNNNFTPYSGAAYVFTGFVSRPALSLMRNGSSSTIQFSGVPGMNYELQRAPNVTGPWQMLTVLTSPPSGQLQFVDTSPPPARAFYRTAQP